VFTWQYEELSFRRNARLEYKVSKGKEWFFYDTGRSKYVTEGARL